MFLPLPDIQFAVNGPQTASHKLTGDTMSTGTTTRTIRFLSDKPGLRLIRRSWGEIFMAGSRAPVRNPSEPEIDYQFEGGALEVREGQDLLPDSVDPETGEVVEQDAAAWIRSHRQPGVTIHEVEPVAPPAGDVLGLVARAAAKGDIDALIALGDEEAATWNREDVLDVIRDAVESIAPPEAA